MEKKILDVTCGSRTIWFNKHHPAAVYCDKRREQYHHLWKMEIDKRRKEQRGECKMSMTREEAIEELERLLRHWDDLENGKRCFWGYDQEAVALALSALRPVSREQVERMRGEWIAVGAITCKCSRCQHSELSTRANEYLFCPACGAPMTDEAVQMVMEKLKKVIE